MAARGGGAPLVLRHALRRLEQAAARHREVAVAAGAWTQLQTQRQASSSLPSHPTAGGAPAAAAQQHHRHREPLTMHAMSSSGVAAHSILLSSRARPRPPTTLLLLQRQRRAISLLAGLASLVAPPSADSNSSSSSDASQQHDDQQQQQQRRAYRERRLVHYPPELLFGVVADVSRYSEFVPWCRRSRVLRRSPDGGEMEAELEVGFQALSERYVSRVRLQPPTTTTGTTTTGDEAAAAAQQQHHHQNSSTPSPPIAVVEATTSRSMLFEHLASTWTLRPGPQPGTTWLSFAVDFGFASPAHRHVADLFFDQVVRRMVAAFEGRCAALYGPSSALEKRRRVVEAAGAEETGARRRQG